MVWVGLRVSDILYGMMWILIICALAIAGLFGYVGYCMYWTKVNVWDKAKTAPDKKPEQ